MKITNTPFAPVLLIFIFLLGFSSSSLVLYIFFLVWWVQHARLHSSIADQPGAMVGIAGGCQTRWCRVKMPARSLWSLPTCDQKTGQQQNVIFEESRCPPRGIEFFSNWEAAPNWAPIIILLKMKTYRLLSTRRALPHTLQHRVTPFWFPTDDFTITFGIAGDVIDTN